VLRRRTVARICRIRRERREANLVDEVRAEDEEERAKSVVRGAIGAEATAARDEETTIESNRIESIRFDFFDGRDRSSRVRRRRRLVRRNRGGGVEVRRVVMRRRRVVEEEGG
jgi:hypothetical protein